MSLISFWPVEPSLGSTRRSPSVPSGSGIPADVEAVGVWARPIGRDCQFAGTVNGLRDERNFQVDADRLSEGDDLAGRFLADQAADEEQGDGDEHQLANHGPSEPVGRDYCADIARPQSWTVNEQVGRLPGESAGERATSFRTSESP